MSGRAFRLVVSIAASVLVALVVATNATGANPASAPPVVNTIAYTRVIDLSHRITPKIPLWPGDPHVRFKVVASWADDGYYLRSFSIGEHSATHMNAPNSFIDGNRQAITSYPARQRVVPAVVIDVRAAVSQDPDYRLSKDDVLAWEAEHGQIAPGSFVILFTGWQDRWDHPKAFINQDARGDLHFPGFAGPTTTWLLDQRQISGVGIDTHGVDPGLDTTYATNTQIAAAHKIAIECMANLDQLPPTGTTLVLGPLQLRGGSGSPLSVMAFVP
jgi:kynurenine formamidase